MIIYHSWDRSEPVITSPCHGEDSGFDSRRSRLRLAEARLRRGKPVSSRAKAENMHYVYFLLCKNGKVYTGSTNDLKDRLARHQKGQVFFTKDRLPVKLVAYIALQNKYTAFNLEKYLKSGSGRAFIKKHRIVEP